jgi:uncharacterized membrane protein YdjX (TVP38/TMEM64 family)
MEAAANEVSNTKSKAVIKAVIFLAFIVTAILLVRFTPIKGYLTAEKLKEFQEIAGAWMPFVFIVIYAAGVCLFLPGTLLTGLGAALFGAYWGFVYVWFGAMIGSSAGILDRKDSGQGICRIIDRRQAKKI